MTLPLNRAVSRVSAGGGGGGTVLADWTLIQDTDQTDDTPVDSLSLADTGTGFTPGTGVFRHVWATHTSATNADGYREGVLWWSKNLLTVQPLFDPDVHRLELRIDFSSPGQFAFAGTQDSVGAFVGLADAALDSGAANASIMAMVQTGAAQFQARKLATASQSNYGSLTVTTGNDQGVITIGLWRVSTGYSPETTAMWRVTGSSPSEWVGSTGNPTHETIGSTLANLRIVTGSCHQAATDAAGRDIRWRVYHRLVYRASAA